MLVWGMKLVLATWGNSVDEFPWLSVGVTYLPIAVSGAMMFLFVVERLTIGPPASSRRRRPRPASNRSFSQRKFRWISQFCF